MSTFAIDLISGKQFLFNETFINSGTTIFTGITSGNNGLSIGAPHQLKLGGTLTCSTILTKGIGNIAGLEYGGDYSAGYSNRSLVDKGYIGTNYFNKSQINAYSADTLTELRHLENYTGNGVISGFTITINSDPTKINISSGLGIIINNYTNPNIPVKTKLIFSGKTGVILTGLTLNNITYLAIDANGHVIQQQTEFLAVQRRDYILIGAAIHSNKTIVNAINNLPDVVIDALDQYNDLLDSLRNFNAEGNVFSPNGSNLYINKSSGKIFKKGVNFTIDNRSPHRITLPALTAPANIRYRLSDGTEYLDTNSISMYYESPLGTRVPLPSSGYSIQRLTLFPSNLIRIQYGQAKYDTMGLAKQLITTEVFTTEQNIAQNGLLRGYLIVKGSAISLTNTNDALFVEADKFGAMPLGASVGATTLQQAYINSTIPIITTSVTEGSVIFKRGTLADSDDVFEILNGAGNITASINGTGTGKFNAFKPTGDTTTALQIRKANGIIPIINVNTVSGFTGFGTVAPVGLIHTYGTDNTPDNGFNIQTNGIRLDGTLDADKDIAWLDNGKIKFVAQIFRGEEGKFWYLYNNEDQNSPITVSESGRIGINNKTNFMNYHAMLLNGGPNDINIGGVYTQNYTTVFEIQISSVTGTTDKFEWRISLDNGLTYGAWSAPINCSVIDTPIEFGVTAVFDSITGHTLGTTFEFPAFAQLPIGTFVISTNAFTEVQTTNNYNADPIIYNDITASANSGSLGGDITIFHTGTTNNAIYFGTKIKIDSVYINLKTAGAGITNTVYLQYLNSSSGWTTISTIADNYVDGTLSLSQSGALTWDSTFLTDWIPENMKNLVRSDYQLYWLRLVTTSSPTIAPVANSFARGGNYRFAVISSPADVKPAMYIDSIGRTNIGGGNISGCNVFQINVANNVEAAGGATSIVEIDSQDSSVTDFKVKLASDDSLGTGISLVKTRGALSSSTGICSGDTLGRIDFRGRVGTCGRLLTQICSQYIGDGTTRCGDIVFSTACSLNPTEKVRITSVGNTGFGITNPNAIIHLKAGTITNAPLKFTCGALLTTPQIGAMEFNGYNFYGTVTGNTRHTFAYLENPTFTGNVYLPSGTTYACGVATNIIKPLNDGLNTLKITSATGGTVLVTFNSLSGFTGFGTVIPRNLVHLYGTNNTNTDGWNYQTNGLKLDGNTDTDKTIIWANQGVNAWEALTYRGENNRYWYLATPQSHNVPITISNTGRVGIDNQTNIMDSHPILISGGTNDLEIGGVYTQNYTIVYQVQIYSTGVTDTFRWRGSTNNGDTYTAWSTPSGCTTGNTLLQYGVTVTFDSITGHQLNTLWLFVAFAQLPIGTFVVTPNKFPEIQTTNDYTANPIIYDDITGEGNSSTFGALTTIFHTGVTNNAIYFGTFEKLNATFFNLSTAGQGVTLITEYWNGTSWVNLSLVNNSYIDGTFNLTTSGGITWETSSMTDWIPSYLLNLSGDTTNFLYWIRFRTTTPASVAPIATSFARGGNYRIAVLTSPYDFKSSFYVDSLGRTNIGGGNMTGGNVFQINPYQNTPVSAGITNSLAEFDSENSSIVDLKIKLSSNDVCGAGLTLAKTRGTLLNPLNTQVGDSAGHVNFKGRCGSTGIFVSQINSQYIGNGNGDMIFNNANGGVLSEKVRITSSGTTGFGISTPVAVVHLKAGTTSIAPLKFTAGCLLSVPQVGAVEFDGYCFYFTVTGSTVRKTFAPLESPQFSGNANLPVTTCLNSTSLCNYILISGGTNNNTLTKKCDFNAFTGATQPIRDVAITGATNGLNKPTAHSVGLGGNLTQDTVITGNTYNFTLSGKLLNICGVNGIEIIDTSIQGIDINSNGNSVDIRGGTLAGVEKTKFLVSATQATFTDSRTTPVGIQYNADYSANYSDRSLVDKAYVISQASGLIPLAAVEVATTANINIATAPATIGGVTLISGMRILVKNQITGSENGIYDFHNAGNPLTRSSDFSGGTTNWKGTYVSVISGATNQNTSWILNTPNPITIGITSLTFVLFNSQTGVAAGNGISVTQSGGNNVVAIKLAGSCGLCSDNSGLYITPTIGGIGVCFDGNSLCFNGAGVAGNSLYWTGTQLAVNTTGGTLNSALNLKLNVNTFSAYTGATLITINSKATQASLVTYTGTTAPATYATKSSFIAYTGSTAPNTYVKITCYDAYTGATQTLISHKAFLSGATFTGVVNVCTPAVNDNSHCVINSAWYLGQCASTTPLVDSGCGTVGTSTLWAHQDHVHPIDTSRAAQASLVTYTGTTAPATYVGKSAMNIYTGTTAPATYVGKSAMNIYTGTTAPATYVKITCYDAYTGATQTLISHKAFLSGATFTGVVNVCKAGVNDNTNCAASTSWYISQGATALPLMDGTVACGISNMFARQDHVHPRDTTKLFTSGGTMTGTLKGTIFTGNTCVISPITIGTTCVCSPVILGSTCVSGAITCGTSCVQTALLCSTGQVKGTIITGSTCLTSAVIIALTCSNSPLHCGACTLATTCVCSPVIIGSTCVCGAIVCSNTCMLAGTCVTGTVACFSSCIRSPLISGSTVCGSTCVQTALLCSTGQVKGTIVTGSTCVISPVVLGSTSVCSPTVCSSTCLCAAGTSRLVGAATLASTLNVSGITKHTTTVCLLATPAIACINMPALFWDSTSKAISALVLTGGSDSYFYAEKTTQDTCTAAGPIVYLSGTPWSFKAGRYQVDFNAVGGNSAANGITCIIFRCNGTAIARCIQMRPNGAVATESYSISRDLTFSAGCACLEIVYGAGSSTACISYGMIRAKRIC